MFPSIYLYGHLYSALNSRKETRRKKKKRMIVTNFKVLSGELEPGIKIREQHTESEREREREREKERENSPKRK